ncbi:platelet-activating factor acetylhydrolase, isoform II-domain-containing protein [Cladorrhinum sp. PSN259]|nr:platelet-activating factor acetylhydrolase, isoform II-domain-containing protein [Cladorrhinum sp. PSN259]
MIFSHGLGGNRNAYSHIAGSLASYGVVVICPEHRDASAALTLVRDPDNQNRFFTKNTRHVVSYQRIPHNQDPEIWAFRNKQLRIRLWEINHLFEAVLSLDRGNESLIKSNLNNSTPAAALSQFTNKLDVLEPGKVIFAGHSFGAATIVQLLKSVYYGTKSHPAMAGMTSPLFVPRPGSALSRQITSQSPAILLDMWCFPLLSAATKALYDLPLPCYAAGGPGGSGILAIESDQFFKWGEHLRVKARILSPDPSAERVQFADNVSRPHFFYVEKSAHLSQSDFAILFPWLTKKAFGSDAPERVLRLNNRAQLQFLRNCGIKVAPTVKGDLVEGPGSESQIGEEGLENDEDILQAVKEGTIESWKWLDVVELDKDGKSVYPSELEVMKQRGAGERNLDAEKEEKGMGREMEPGIGDVVEGEAENANTKAQNGV